MSHFNFENDINSLLKMDAPLSKGPQMRWQRKMNESANACNESGLNVSANVSVSAKTPMKVLNKSASANKTPAKTPCKTPSSVTKTPGWDKSLFSYFFFQLHTIHFCIYGMIICTLFSSRKDTRERQQNSSGSR